MDNQTVCYIPKEEMNEMLSKAINTVEPQKQYPWVMDLCNLLDNKKERVNLVIKLY